MPREPKGPTMLDLEQRELFRIEEEPHLVPMVKRWTHNAETTMKDEARVFSVCEALVQGVAVIAIARAQQMSPKTVRAIRREMQDGGKLAHIKTRVIRDAWEFVADGTALMNEKLAAGELTPGEISVFAGIISDKLGQWEGGTNLVIEHRVTQVIPNVDHLNKLFAGAIDVESTAPKQIPEQSQGIPALGPCAGPCAEPDLVPTATAPDAPTAEAASVEGGGGGRDFAPGVGHADTSASAEFAAKRSSEEGNGHG